MWNNKSHANRKEAFCSLACRGAWACGKEIHTKAQRVFALLCVPGMDVGAFAVGLSGRNFLHQKEIAYRCVSIANELSSRSVTFRTHTDRRFLWT